MHSMFIRPATGLAAALFVFSAAAGALAAQARDIPPVFVGGALVHEPALLEHGHLLVPVRGVFETLHATVTYTAPRIVVVRKNGAVIAGLVVDRTHAVVNNRPFSLAAAPIRLDGRVYVPLRIIAEIAGATVSYSGSPPIVDIRLPYSEPIPMLTVAQAAPPADTTPPAWAIGIVGVLVLAFVFECLRRFAVMLAGRRARVSR